MFSLFKTTSYKTGAALAVGATSFWKLISFLNSVLVALYFGAGADTDVYFYLIMVIGFGVTFMQRLNNSVLIPEAMFLAEADLSQSRRFLTLGFYFYLLLALVLCLLGLTFPAGIIGLVSRFEPALLAREQVLLGAAFLLFATNLLVYYLTAVAEMHKFFSVALLVPLNAACPLLALLFLGRHIGIISMMYGFLAANFLQITILICLLKTKLHWDFVPRPCTVRPAARKNMLTGQTLAVMEIVNSLLPLYMLSGMGAGVVSALNYCKQLTDSPTEIVTNRVANISKIELTENASRGQINVFNKNFLSTNHLLLFILTPLAVFSCYFATDIVGLFFERGRFTAQAAADTARFLRPLIFTVILLVPSNLQSNTVVAWLKVKEAFPYMFLTTLALAAAWFLLPVLGPYAYPYIVLGGLIFGFIVNAFLFKRYFPFVNYFRSFWELLRLLAINIIALVPAAAVRMFMGEDDYFLNLLFGGSVYVAALLLVSYKSRDLQLFLKSTEISRIAKKLF